METTERIVEAYVRYIKGCATIPNIRCKGQQEIDLLAINLLNPKQRYHIETSVHITGPFRKLTVKAYDADALKKRVTGPQQRRTMGFFLEKKFGTASVAETLKSHGFVGSNYKKVIVSWGWDEDVLPVAKASAIELWDFRDLLAELAAKFEKTKSYFGDDTVRTMHLAALAEKDRKALLAGKRG